MLEHGEELNLRMLQPLDTDTTAGILRESGYLVPLSKWSKARQDYKGNTDRWAFNIMACAFIGLMVACLEMWSTRNIPIKLPKYTPVAVFLLGFAFGWVQLLGTSDRRKRGFDRSRIIQSKYWSLLSTFMWLETVTRRFSTRPDIRNFFFVLTALTTLRLHCLFGKNHTI